MSDFLQGLVEEVARANFKPDPAVTLEQHIQYGDNPRRFGELLSVRERYCTRKHPFSTHIAFAEVAAIIKEKPAIRDRKRKRRSLALYVAANEAGLPWVRDMANNVDSVAKELLDLIVVAETLVQEELNTPYIVPLTESLIRRLILSTIVKIELMKRRIATWPEKARSSLKERIRQGIKIGLNEPEPPTGMILDPNVVYGFSQEARMDSFFILTAEQIPEAL